MSQRKRNMLEAFQASKAADSKESGPSTGGSPRQAGGPFAGEPGREQGDGSGSAAAPSPDAESSAAAPRATPAQSSPRVSPSGSAAEGDGAPAVKSFTLTGSMLGPVALSQLILLALAFWAGRVSVTPVQASAPAAGEVPDDSLGIMGVRPPSATGPGAAGARTGEPGAAAAAPSGAAAPHSDEGPADTAFFDPGNRFTIAVIEYPNTEYWQERVWKVYGYLERQALPVVRPILRSGSIRLCVGARPTMEGTLTDLRDRVRALPGPDPGNDPAPFSSAYFMNIDDLIRR